MSDGDEPGGYVPVPAAALDALDARTREVEAAGKRVRKAIDALAELARDYRNDAVRRLQERGASEAQVARYEDSLDAALGTLRQHQDDMDEACETLRRQALTLL
ncbi:MAG: hypothetical protein AB8I08_15980 [Sandaracinaceae bacterium]